MVYNCNNNKTKIKSPNKKDCTLKMRNKQLFLPLELEKIIEPTESVRTLDKICEALDYTKLYKAYNRKRHQGEVAPDTFFIFPTFCNISRSCRPFQFLRDAEYLRIYSL